MDDEAGIREMIEDALSLAGYSPVSCSSATEAQRVLKHEQIDMVITDVAMPVVDGFEFVRQIRESGNDTPVVFLSARNQKFDINHGLRLGADDYIAKPFGIEELTLRVAAILRRTKGATFQEDLTCGPITLSVDSHRVWRGTEELQLSPTEFRLLQFLMENKGRALSKYSLLDEVWGMGFAENATVLDTYISYLRKKVHTDQFQGVKTVRGIGFKIEDK